MIIIGCATECLAQARRLRRARGLTPSAARRRAAPDARSARERRRAFRRLRDEQNARRLRAARTPHATGWELCRRIACADGLA